jgi:hypothetical protein
MEKEIVGYKSGYCPKCGKMLTEYVETEFIDGGVLFRFECPCGAAGNEYYTMVYEDTVVEYVYEE